MRAERNAADRTTGRPDEVRCFLPLGVHAVSTARQFVGDTLASWGVDESTAGSALLVTSELTTNAVLYGHGAGWLALRHEPDALVVEVSDRAPAELALHAAPSWDGEATLGRGLRIVETVCQDWGVRPTDDGKVVWCTLALPDR